MKKKLINLIVNVGFGLFLLTGIFGVLFMVMFGDPRFW